MTADSFFLPPAPAGGFSKWEFMEVFMIDFLDLLFDVMFYPLDPANLALQDNPLVLSCLAVLIGLAVMNLFGRICHGLLG